MFRAYPFLSGRSLKLGGGEAGRGGRARRVPASSQPWLVRVMLASNLLCAGTVVHQHFVLTVASCLTNTNFTQPLYIQAVPLGHLVPTGLLLLTRVIQCRTRHSFLLTGRV